MTDQELKSVAGFVMQLIACGATQAENLIFEWAKTGHINKRQHVLLCKWYYGADVQKSMIIWRCKHLTNNTTGE